MFSKVSSIVHKVPEWTSENYRTVSELQWCTSTDSYCDSGRYIRELVENVAKDIIIKGTFQAGPFPEAYSSLEVTLSSNSTNMNLIERIANQKLGKVGLPNPVIARSYKDIRFSINASDAVIREFLTELKVPENKVNEAINASVGYREAKRAYTTALLSRQISTLFEEVSSAKKEVADLRADVTTLRRETSEGFQKIEELLTRK
ncbi:MAG: hypothetical protein JSS09_08295 [Verrucomicrobia bacterium]|nr:hypothetical protein [Verrucomicrobiota bacterium]